MPKQKAKTTVKKTVVIKMCKAHRILIVTGFSLLFLFMLVAMIYLISSSEFGFGINFLLLTVPTILFLPCPLYYATWQITFDTEGIQKCLFWVNQKCHGWAEVKEVHSAWLTSERNHIVSIIFKDGKTIRFRMDCENGEKARKLILSHCSIVE